MIKRRSFAVVGGAGPVLRTKMVYRNTQRRLSDAARLLSLEPDSMVYVGPRVPGNTNLGDELLFWAHRLAYCEATLRQITFATPRLSGVLSGDKVRGIVLGGGTLIGLPTFRAGLDSSLRSFRGVPLTNLGTGVDDPSLPALRGMSERDSFEEIRRWKPLVAEMETLWVRGPLSKRILDEVGINSRVSGDPALLLFEAPTGEVPAERGFVGVNVGVSGNVWHSSEREFLHEIAQFTQALSDRGYAPILYSMWVKDDAITREIAAASGVRSVLSAELRSIQSLSDFMGSLDCNVAMKLHAVVAAAGVGVPSIALEYRPKCRDFQESIGMGEWSLKTSEVSSTLLLSRVTDLLSKREQIVANLRAMLGVRISAILEARSMSRRSLA